MKKIYFLASLLLAGSAFSQSFAPYQRAMTAQTSNGSHVNTTEERAAGDIIAPYSDNFSVPGNWTVANSGSPSVNFSINSTGPGSADPIASTSGGNFAWYDCDPQGDGSTVDATVTYNTVMNLTAYPFVMVSFEQYYVEYQTETYVEVSTNGLAGPWTQYELNQEYGANDPSPTNPVAKLINISAQAGGQANVAVRFHYTGGWGWSWQIDDFAMVEAYQHDLTVTENRMSAGTETNEYYMIPTSQITEFTFGSLITSNGVTTQTNTYMNVQIDGGTTYDEVSTQNVDLAEGVTDTFSIEAGNGWTPAGAGSYDVEFIGITDDFTDELAADNVIALEPVIVGGNVYARDNGIIQSGFVGFVSTSGDPLEVGNTFEFFAPATFGKVQVGVTTTATNEGQSLYATVYVWDDGITDWSFVTNSTADHVVTAGDLGAIIEFNLNDDVVAAAGEVYLVCGGHYGGATPLYIAEAQNTADFSVAAIHSTGTIYGAEANAIIARVVLAPSEAGVEDIAATTGFIAYPNPASENVTVSYNLNKGGNVALTITDIAGNVVMTNNFGTQTEGAHKANLDTESLANGVYFYTLNVDGETTTKKLTIANN